MSVPRMLEGILRALVSVPQALEGVPRTLRRLQRAAALSAIERQNRDVAYLYKPLHLAVLRVMQSVVAAARSAGIPVSICGERGEGRWSALLLSTR